MKRKMAVKHTIRIRVQKLIGLSGRADRGDYFKIQLLTALLCLPIVVAFITEVLVAIVALGVVTVFLVVPLQVSINIRRLHDLGSSGWFYLLNFIPLISWVYWLYPAFTPGEAHSNKYGSKPNVKHPG